MEQNTETTNQQTVVFPEKPKKKHKGVLIFLGLLAAVILLAMIIGLRGCESGYGNGGPYVAVMYIEGEIGDSNYDSLGRAYGYQHDWTMDQLDRLADDPDNMGILFYVDSPGGAVYQSDELYLAIEEYKEITGCPVYVYMGPYGASGAYYISAAADKIFTNRNTWTGSIGVTIGTMFDFSQLLERYGVQSHTIDSGAMKSAGNGWDELTPEQQAYFQGLVDDAYEQFVDVVAQGRGLSVEQVKKLADGRIYTAKQAKELGLTDGIGSMDDAMTDMQTEYDLWDCDFVDVTYDYDDSWGLSDLLYLLSGQSKEQEPLAQAKAQAEVEDPLKYLFTTP